jgi:thioesterase domain-containing protein
VELPRRLIVLSLVVVLGTWGLGGQGLMAQEVREHYEPMAGVLRIGPEPNRAVALTERGHTLILPENSAQGVVVFIDPRRFRSEAMELRPGEFETEALRRDVAVLHVTTGNPLDFLFEDREVDELARRIRDVLQANGLAGTPVFIAGLSLGGTRALRLAAFLAANGAPYGLRATAVAIVDAPLDMVRLWKAERRAAMVGFHPAAADEGRWVTYLLETHLGGNPREAREEYVRYSPFVFGEEGGGNASHLRDIAVRAYHEPDVDWWIEHRRKSYYSMNSLDMAALVNELRLLGNARASLVTTHGRRAGYDDAVSPHTWSIVDNAELVDWFLRQAAR